MSTRLGFGCAPILGRVGKKDALRALHTAYDNGIRHFDVARSYGFGEAEGLLGEFIADKRQDLTVTTKFGVVPPRNTRALGLAKSFARGWLKRLPGGQKMVSAASRVALANRNYAVDYARDCLEESLRQLRTGYIDYYMIHDPPSSEVVTDELLRFLEDAQRDGKIRHWGLTAESADMVYSPTASRAQAVLFEANLNLLDRLPVPEGEGKTWFVSRPYAGGPAGLAESAAQPAVRAALAELGLPRLDDNQLAMYFALSMAGDRGIVIASMFSDHHIRQNAALAAEYLQLGEQGKALAKTILRYVAAGVPQAPQTQPPAGALPTSD
ncbi:aldo/keto reductase [Cupriavidus sp. AU9028]|uniref:aldo/keto reductase n=1 Tax=Cupriavidus sp. AU9028 TaxID=2871157 RepID=UPI001C98591F|nr:aldo/keto reductase [Cupriavidus sp. AU9028]MBY4898862.1 aldo/keto reductase [Cupriavidus sp. AU9028]